MDNPRVYELLVQKRSITNRRTSRFKMRFPGLLRFKSNERFAAAQEENSTRSRPEEIVLRPNQILVRFLSR
jgi:hypothetical protein